MSQKQRPYELVIDPQAIDFAPTTQAQEILQNVLTICTTAKETVPLDREFGIDGVFIDEPMSRVKAAYTQEVVKAVRKFEPRARVSRVEFFAGVDGKVYPRVFVKIIG